MPTLQELYENRKELENLKFPDDNSLSLQDIFECGENADDYK